MVDSANPTCYPQVTFERGDNSKSKYLPNPFALVEGPKPPTLSRSRDFEQFTTYCPDCNKNFPNQDDYDRHNTQIHLPKRPVSCTLCTATFKRQDHLKRHVQSIHSSLKYTTCPVCYEDCKRQDLLKTHMKNSHANEPQVYHCRDCKFECNSLNELENHENTHYAHERHVCQQCQSSFKRRDHMLRHVKSQHMNQVITCPICPQSYKRKDHLVRHVREKHRMGLLNGKLVKADSLCIENEVTWKNM